MSLATEDGKFITTCTATEWQRFTEMTDLPEPLRHDLEAHLTICPLTEHTRLTSKDGSTDKVLFALDDGKLIETVLMRYAGDGHRRRRSTICVSTQAGCALGCTFCATGQQGFERHLTVAEIVAQILVMKRIAASTFSTAAVTPDHSAAEEQSITNVVFMGMGEPLHNYANTIKAIRIINDDNGLGIGARKITVSTVGLVPQIRRLATENLQINLAVSLHAPDDQTRSQTMPINHRWGVSQLMAACRDYTMQTKRRIFFEYVLLSEQNDSSDHAYRLGKLLQNMLAHVNLIPVNPTQNLECKRPTTRVIKQFQEVLYAMGVPSTVRMEKGIDINAGCGQLRARVVADHHRTANG